MRIIGTLLNEHHARRLCAYLQRANVQTSCDMSFDAGSGHMSYPIWVHDEDQIGKALEVFTQFQKNPNAPEFDVPLVSQLEQSAEIGAAPQEQILQQSRSSGRVTIFFISLCALFFFWNAMQEVALRDEVVRESPFVLTPIEATLLYDLPPAFDSMPTTGADQIAALGKAPFWHGIYDWFVLKTMGKEMPLAVDTMFHKIRQGEIWRLFSPALFHRDFLHILFNMIWLWILGRPIEQRIGSGRTILLTLLLGVFSNTMQYLVSGPFFLGYSGIVMGLAGFIWVRERIAPWEGYPLHRSTILFLAFYIGAMILLQLSSFFLLLFTSIHFVPNIANTAHIGGALLGIALARLKFFSARVRL